MKCFTPSKPPPTKDLLATTDLPATPSSCQPQADLTSLPSNSSGTEIFISIFMDSNTQRGSPALRMSPTETL